MATVTTKKHPHARGEDLQNQIYDKVKEETPPRTWGRQEENENEDADNRNTPTHVGKTREICI